MGTARRERGGESLWPSARCGEEERSKTPPRDKSNLPAKGDDATGEYKAGFTINEASEYTGIGRNTMRNLVVPGYREPLSLNTVVFALPGERKSSVMRDMTQFLYDYERELNEGRQTEIRRNRQERGSLEKYISGLQEKLRHDTDQMLELELQQMEVQLEEMPVVKPVRFFADDCSSEALTNLLAKNDSVPSVISMEGGIFDIMAGRYNNRVNIDIHKIIWTDRNDVIVGNIRQVIRDNPGKNIFVVFGADHIYWLQDALRRNSKSKQSSLYPISEKGIH